jgi:hypothetical protein
MSYELKGVLTLRGKRITGHHTEEVTTEMVRPFTDDCIYVKLEIIDCLRMRKDLFCYYEDGKIVDMTPIQASIDKAVIQAGTDEHAIYRIRTDEETDIMISQVTGNVAPALTLKRKPVEGEIRLEIDSKVVGEVRICTISDTKYSREVTVLVV